MTEYKKSEEKKGKMDYHKINKTVMDDTQELCDKVAALKNAVASSIEREYDFANSHSVGGAPWSAGAQEESMCRTSTLYPCLYAEKRDFYELHSDEFDAGEIDEMGTDDLIYVPDVVVFKTDESVPKLKDEDSWFKTDVIVSAAPELDWGYDDIAYEKIMESRIKRILDVASKENVQVLILGAFGCGAFQNPPEVVSSIFARLIRKYDFEIVEFAVFCRDDTKNFDVFQKRLAKIKN